MLRPQLFLATLIAAGGLTSSAQTNQAESKAPKFPSHPDFKPTPEVPAMPKALMKLPRTNITRAKFPAIDFHLHGRALRSAEDYQKMIKLMNRSVRPLLRACWSRSRSAWRYMPSPIPKGTTSDQP